MAAPPAADPAIEPIAEPTPGSGSDWPPGSARFDPVRRCYLEALARRSQGLAGPAKALMESRLAVARAAYRQAFDAARAEAAGTMAVLQSRFPNASEPLRRHASAGDLAALRRLDQRLGAQARTGLLCDLLNHIDRQPAGTERPAAAAAPRELKTVHRARDTWTRLRLERQLAWSMARLPDNAGPLNSHRLVLRCLQRLQSISPPYLAHLLSQLDTWVWLEQAGAAAPREGRSKR